MTTPCPACATLRDSLARSEDEVKRLRAALSRPPGGVAMRIDVNHPVTSAATDLYKRTADELDKAKRQLATMDRLEVAARAAARQYSHPIWGREGREPGSAEIAALMDVLADLDEVRKGVAR